MALFGAQGVDVLTVVDGMPLDRSDALVAYLRAASVGDAVELSVLRTAKPSC
jgi:S1-C subfamily serine protease